MSADDARGKKTEPGSPKSAAKKAPGKPGPGMGPEGAPMTLEALRAYLEQPAVRARAVRIVRRRAAERLVEELVHDAYVDAMKARRRPQAANVQAWFDVVCRRTVADHHEKRRHQKPHEGPMPVAEPRRDEGGLPVEDDDVDGEDAGPFYDPERERAFRADALLLRSWADEHLTDPEERETFGWMCEWAEGDVTYADIAAAHDVSLAALSKRVERLKARVGPAFTRYRNRTVAFWLLLGTAALGLAILVLYGLLRGPAPQLIAPVPAREMVRPPPSADAAPRDTPFEPALPPSAVPPLVPLPKQP